jgi:regulator of cell morphogenesis and NO signaling
MSPLTDGSIRTRPVGEVVADDYRRGAVFKQFGIDFCCGGGRTVEEACARKGVDIEALEAALETSDLPRGEDRMPDPRDWDPAFLADYIVQVHHTYCRESLPVLRAFAGKVARVHGPHTPELVSVDRTVRALSEEMEAHMAAEEGEVFPAIKKGEGASAALEQMEEEHEASGGLMAEIRELTSDFTPPAGACATWRAMYAKLEEFEADLHRHVHLENNVLFPAVRGA